MKQLELNQLEALQGGASSGWWAGVACGAGIMGTALLFSNPVTGTAAAMGSGFIVGSLIGTCAGLLSIN